MEGASVLIAGAAVAVNIGALIVAVVSMTHSHRKTVNESEQRITHRIGTLEQCTARMDAKLQRAEQDIQRIFSAIPKRATDA